MLNADWGRHTPSQESSQTFRFGALEWSIKLLDGDLWYRCRYQETAEGTAPSSDDDWVRTPLPDADPQVIFSPILPDLPIVVSPEQTLMLPAGSVLSIYARWPLWVRMTLDGDPPRRVADQASVVLSRTWFGSFTEGELCYWLTSGTRRRTAPDPERPHLAICPIHIQNVASDELEIEKVCLRVQTLSLFRSSDGQLWTDEIRVSYRGDAGRSHVQAAGTAPREAPDAEFVADPRDPVREELVARTFRSLMKFPGVGFLIDE